MKSDKVEMNKGLLEAWLGAVHENDLPVNIQTGKEFDDCNGDRMVECLWSMTKVTRCLLWGL